MGHKKSGRAMGQRKLGRVMDIREAGSRGGKARARNKTKEELAAIGRLGGEAARGKPRKPYKKRRKQKKKADDGTPTCVQIYKNGKWKTGGGK